MFFKKKSLGQHFLASPHYLGMIADAAQLLPGERVLEVGPGEGALTGALLRRGALVTAVEKDRRLIPVLQETFAEEIAAGKLRVVEGDALEHSLEDIGLSTGAYKVVANIPYYITGALLKKFLTEKNQPTLAVLLVQKEVAQRIAREKKESILSLSVKAYGVPEYVKTVPAGAFAPPPQVDSAILKINNISRQNFAHAQEEARFFEILKAGFGQKRKLLRKNVAPVLKNNVDEAFTRAHIAPSARAEDVSLSSWLALARE